MKIEKQGQYQFNTLPYLWESKRQSLLSCPNGGELMRVTDGHVHGSSEVFARFADNEHAKRVLTEAGFNQVEGGFKA